MSMKKQSVSLLGAVSYTSVLCFFLSVAPVIAETASSVATTVDLTTASSATDWRHLLSQLPAGVKLQQNSLLEKLYTENHFQLFWQDKQAAKQLQEQLAEIAVTGISPQFSRWAKWLSETTTNDTAKDLILSDALVGYLQYIESIHTQGKNLLYSNTLYTLKLPSMAEISHWQEAYKRQQLTQYIEGLAPQNPQYLKMHGALKRLIADSKTEQHWPIVESSQSLKPGMTSHSVPEIAEILQRMGIWKSAGHNQGSKADNHYGGELVEAVKQFQREHGLSADGVIGKRTREWLNVTPQQRIRLLALNIQRLRILPEHLDTAIMVNIADFSLIYYKNGQEALTSRVIVGTPKRKTPLMDASLKNIVVNPPWNVPTKLIREDIIPKIKQDPGYLSRHNYTIYSSWAENAHAIDPGHINWGETSAKNFPYRLKQSPGSHNALGHFKFNMPNSEAIYLHDTPNKQLFEKDIRALSSGCIRINKATDLAYMLLQEVGWDQKRVDSSVKKGDTRYVNVSRHIPVELYYLTAWVSDKGIPQYRTDIYDYDQLVRTDVLYLPQIEQLLL